VPLENWRAFAAGALGDELCGLLSAGVSPALIWGAGVAVRVWCEDRVRVARWVGVRVVTFDG
jgi:hypothetical protein